MDYIELKVKGLASGNKDLLIYFLGEEGFESFLDMGDDLLAYIPVADYNPDKVKALTETYEGEISVSLIQQRNWNEEWEKNFPPVTIDGRCYIRAPFHPPLPGIEYEIVIMPKMSFGTAHHETTAQMISLMLEVDFKGKKVLDMGCGTGILAVMAEKLGASEILAVDNDTWAFENAKENVLRNNCNHILVKQGELAEANGDYSIILANINRNILLAQIKEYSRFSHSGSILVMSGFYEEDLQAITQCAWDNGFTKKNHISKNKWVAAIFIK